MKTLTSYQDPGDRGTSFCCRGQMTKEGIKASARRLGTQAELAAASGGWKRKWHLGLLRQVRLEGPTSWKEGEG